MNSHLKNSNEGEERIVPLRLQKFLARSGAASRRGSENLMTAGRVTVNGVVVTELGSKVDPLIDEVALDGMVITYPQKAVTLMLNKPGGYITTMSDPYDRKCVASLVPIDRYPGLFPVGRLDTDTTGLLLFTTDGELGHQVTHPRHHVVKTYRAKVKGSVSEKQADLLRNGIELDDGMTLPASIDVIAQEQNTTELIIKIHEGRKRQVRRMCDAINHSVISLIRESVGNLSLGDLREGKWRYLNENELDLLNKSDIE